MLGPGGSTNFTCSAWTGLTRSSIRNTFELVEAFHSHGVELVSISDGFDLTGPGRGSCPRVG